MAVPAHQGPQFVGKYRTEHELGRGGEGIVYKGVDIGSAQTVAIKTIRVGDKARADEAYDEAQRLRQLNDIRGIPKLLDVIRTEDAVHIVSVFIEGETLLSLVNKRQELPANQRGLPVLDAIRITAAVADILDEVHQREFMHLDIKPENVLLRPDQSVMLVDFGISLTRSDLKSSSSDFLPEGGTPPFMAPELVNRKLLVFDGRPDIYGLGGVFYMLLAGHRPYDESPAMRFYEESAQEIADGNEEKRRELYLALDEMTRTHPSPSDVRQRRRDVSRKVVEIYEKAMRREPSDRYSCARDMAQALRAFVRTQRLTRIGIAFVLAISVVLVIAAFRPSRSVTEPDETDSVRKDSENPKVEEERVVSGEPKRSSETADAAKDDAQSTAKVDSVPPIPARNELATLFENLRFRDEFDNPALSDSVWTFRGSGGGSSFAPRIVTGQGQLILMNRGLAVTRDEFPEGLDVRFRWMWVEGTGTYCDDLSIALRTSGKQTTTGSREISDGVCVRFSTEEGKVSVVTYRSSRIECSFNFTLNFIGGASKAALRCASHDGKTVRIARDVHRGERLHGEWAAAHAVDQQSNVGGVLRQVEYVLRAKIAAELFGENFAVPCSDLKAQQTADVAEDGIGRLFVHLGEILICDGQPQAVFPRLGEDRREC